MLLEGRGTPTPPPSFTDSNTGRDAVQQVSATNTYSVPNMYSDPTRPMPSKSARVKEVRKCVDTEAGVGNLLQRESCL